MANQVSVTNTTPATQVVEVASADPIGSLHFEDGHWVVGDVKVDDMLTHMLGGKGVRLTGVLHLSFDLLPTIVKSTDAGVGGPYEKSEPKSKS